MDDRQFHRLLNFLGLSWRGYRKVRKGVKKRLDRHMQDLGCRDMRSYLAQLALGGEAARQIERVMSVSISRFFRDQRLWEVLEKRILPELIETCGNRVKVWSAGCACGEEVYSLKILWDQMSRTKANLPLLDITASDLNPFYLKRAKAAVYSRSSLKDVPVDLRASCFEVKRSGKQFIVKPGLRTGITWITHNFFSGPPGAGFHLIFIRNNLLTYYKEERTAPVLNEIINALSVGGCMVIGSHEKHAIQSSALQPHPLLPYVFWKEANPSG